jgi:hypothetical protein
MDLNSRCKTTDLGCRKKKVGQVSTILSSLLHWKSRFHPSLLSLGIMRHVGVTHGRQFTGGVFAGVSMQARAVGHDLSILVGQQLRCEFFDLFRRNVQRSRKVGFAEAFWRKRSTILTGSFRSSLAFRSSVEIVGSILTSLRIGLCF